MKLSSKIFYAVLALAFVLDVYAALINDYTMFYIVTGAFAVVSVALMAIQDKLNKK